MEPFRNLIAGSLQKSDTVRTVTNPATGEPAGTIYDCTQAQALTALARAKDAAASMRRSSVNERRELLHLIADTLEAHEDEIADVHVRESGKPAAAARGEVRSGAGFLRYFASIAPEWEVEEIDDTDRGYVHRILRTPIGVAVAFLPFNFPPSQFGIKVGAALAAGNACIVKSSEKAPLAHAVIGSCLAKLDLPAGLLSVVSGDPALLMETLAGSPIPRLVTLIGSTAAGCALARAASSSIKKLDLELGGNAPFIVAEDADLELAASLLVSGKLGNAGQVCVAPNRILVHRSIHDEFVSRCANLAAEYSRDADDPSRQATPLITRESLARVLALVETARREGAILVAGGSRDGSAGNYLEPTLLTGVRPEHTIWRSEIFGPVFPFCAFDTRDEAIALANDTDYGLAAYVCSADHEFCERAGREIHAGTVLVNGQVFGPDLPHGGLNQSGIGKSHSVYALEPYVDIKRVSVRRDGGAR